MIILGIETTCDVTGVGIVKDGRKILANIVASSSLMHQKYGGIVPEVAAREQVAVIVPTLSEALNQSGCKFSDIDAVAVSYGPGLPGSLIVGVETGKTLAAVFEKKLIAVNHLFGHIYANWIMQGDRDKLPETRSIEFPLVASIVSGGHTDLLLMRSHSDFKWLGGTLDDACGEAFDKVARILDLGYPGGPEIERLALRLRSGSSTSQSGKSNIKLPRPMIDSGDFDFSFSGLKTAVLTLVNKDQFPKASIEEIAYEFQEAAFDVLVKKTLRAVNKYSIKSIVVGGGVSANMRLREKFYSELISRKYNVYYPKKNLSTDNGAMIAAAGFFQRKISSPEFLQAKPDLYFD